MQQNNLSEVIERQSVIISIQSGIINDLFQLLSQYVTLDELDKMPVVAKINAAAGLRMETEGGGM